MGDELVCRGSRIAFLEGVEEAGDGLDESAGMVPLGGMVDAPAGVGGSDDVAGCDCVVGGEGVTARDRGAMYGGGHACGATV